MSMTGTAVREGGKEEVELKIIEHVDVRDSG